MLTIVVYVVVTLIVASGLFALSLLVFGRSELLPAVEAGHTVTRPWRSSGWATWAPTWRDCAR